MRHAARIAARRGRRASLVVLGVAALTLPLGSDAIARGTHSAALRRYPYVTDVVGSSATINWATDRSKSAGSARWGAVRADGTCPLEQGVAAAKRAITVHHVREFQWTATISVSPGVTYCYRIYLGRRRQALDLLEADPSPRLDAAPADAAKPLAFAVIGNWGYVDASAQNADQARLLQQIARSGARFVVTTGDNAYPAGTQANYGDLLQVGKNVGGVFGRPFWAALGASMPIYPALGNEGFRLGTHLSLWPENVAAATSGGRYALEQYCCENETAARTYPSAWYAFDAGPARVYVLEAAWDDQNIGQATAYRNDYDAHWRPDRAEMQWLMRDLAAHPGGVKLTVLHYPIYSDDRYHPSDIWLQGANGLEGLLSRAGVRIAFTGHARIYERNKPSPTGLVTYVTGGGGGSLGRIGPCTFLDAYGVGWSTPTNTGLACGAAAPPRSRTELYHFLLVTVEGTQVTVAPTDELGNTFDVVTYDLGKPAEPTVAPLALAVQSFVTVPARPRAGRPFAARMTVVRSDTGRPVAAGRISCTATLAGKRRPAHARFDRGAAVCTWGRIPRWAKRKHLRGKIAVETDGVRAGRTFALVVR